jgi:hypothetical protein
VGVSGGAPPVVVGAGASAAGEQAEGPEVTCLAETFIADDSTGDAASQSARSCHGSGAGEGLDRLGLGEAVVVVAEFGQDSGAEDGAEARHAGDGGCVGMRSELCGGCVFECAGVGHGSVQCVEIGQCLGRHRGLDRGRLPHLPTRSPTMMRSVWRSMFRCRPLRVSAARKVGRRSFAAAPGEGATVNAARASRPARSGKVARNAG